MTNKIRPPATNTNRLAASNNPSKLIFVFKILSPYLWYFDIIGLWLSKKYTTNSDESKEKQKGAADAPVFKGLSLFYLFYFINPAPTKLLTL
ncbi:MAG TPA: hypothetical protein PLR18_00810 [bacterium]|nr:hypothetical protein [bacterium]